MELITLHTKHTTYQMGVSEQGFLLHLYYGKRTEGDMSYLLTYYDRGFSGNPYDAGADRTFSLDVLPQEYPVYGDGDYRSASFNVRDARGVYGCDLRYRSHRIVEGKYAIQGLPAVYAGEEKAYTLEVDLEDVEHRFEVTLKYGVLEELDVITRTVIVKNSGSSVINLQKVYSGSLDFLSGERDILHFHGRHGMERMLERTEVINGIQSFGSKRGTSSHQHNPFFILADRATTEEGGSCYGMSLLYSGNFGCEIEKDQFSQTRASIGIQSEMFDYPLEAGETFHAPEVAYIYTDEGLAELSQKYHRLLRYHVCRGKYRDIRRPVLINNWEATYFDFTGEKIIQIAKQAAELGVEMIVLDDGWFGNRKDDSRGLGDWYVNVEKMGGTLDAVVQQVNALGMKFGLWIEPEMVNEDSELYREHPDWAYAVPGRKPVRARSQLVLDFSRQEVVDRVFDQICEVLDSANIEYIKMDMNRSICDVYSAVSGDQNYGKIMHRYVLGVYAFMDRLLERYPDILIEGCSGGGGRFDAGMLYYTPQIWCSDNTDAIERIQIQHGTSFGYPISAVGSHVSTCPNHQTGRTTNIQTRAVVAMAGSFGYELDLNLVTDAEKQLVKQQIADYKRYWDLIQNGTYFRLHTPGANTEIAAWCFTAQDGSEALLNIVTLDTHCNSPIHYVKCKGLSETRQYRVEGKETVYNGAALMQAGIPIPWMNNEYEALQLHIIEA